MSTLEVLQSCPSQRKVLLSTLGVNDDDSSSMIKFETAGLQPHFPYYVSLLVHVECLNMTVKRTVIDEGAATYVMSLSCWKGLGSPELSKLVTMLTAFDGRYFRPHGILRSLKVCLGGKTVAIEVEVVDAPLDYNLLLGRNWMYSMQAIASSLFRVVCFPHNGNIVTIDQMEFKNPSVTASLGASIPIVEHSQPATGTVGACIHPSWEALVVLHRSSW